MMNEEIPISNDDLKALWCSALEIFFHQLIYVRRLYPKETFQQSRFLGVHVRVNRHQEVVKYISDAVDVAVAALFDGISNEVSLAIIQSKKCEKYYLKLQEEPSKAASIGDVERDMKNLVLGVYALEEESAGGSRWGSSATFKINIFMTGDYQNSPKVSQAFSNNAWFCPRIESEATRAEERRVPMNNHSTPSAAVFSYVMEE